MKYINRGKRDILIFPQFDNIDEIEKIRKQYNELYGKISPHITLGCTNCEEIPIKLQNQYRTIVSKISVELIGENEESNLVFEIELNKNGKANLIKLENIPSNSMD